MQSPGLNTLPTEVLHQILVLVPVTRDVRDLGLVCSRLGGIVLFDARFAALQLETSWRAEGLESLDDFVESQFGDESEWIRLPVAHRLALFAQILREKCLDYSAQADMPPLALPPRLGSEALCWRIVSQARTLFGLDTTHPLLLNWAALHGLSGLVSRLLLAGCDPSRDASALTWAVDKGHTCTVQVLLRDPRSDPAVDDNYALKSAACEGHIALLSLLLNDPRVDPNAQDRCPLNRAAENGHAECVRVLLRDPRLVLKPGDNAALKWSCENGHAEVVRLLLIDGRIHPAARNNFAIKRAAREGHARVVELLLADERTSPESEDNYAIKHSAKNGHIDVVKLLLGDPRVDKNAEGGIALRWAQESGFKDIVKLLQ
ncbi:ankyrin repeat-containing domain protein [Chytriomyces sp. MP71]|nr:ankyrin repeat-containing domain protein [Chytriomyces sp. MP71]